MQIEVDYKPMSKKDYETFIRLLAKMLADFINEQNRTKQAENNAKDTQNNTQ